jgi:hypothetical protein
VPITLKSGSVSFLATCGLAQACNGIALPLFIDKNRKGNKTLSASLIYVIYL